MFAVSSFLSVYLVLLYVLFSFHHLHAIVSHCTHLICVEIIFDLID